MVNMVSQSSLAERLAVARKRYGLTEDEPVNVDVDDSEKEIQSPHSMTKRKEVGSLGDLRSNKTQNKKITT